MNFFRLWFQVIITYALVSLIDHLLRYRKYPVKLRLIWWLIFIGLRTNGLSSEAHRIYNGLQTCSDTRTPTPKANVTTNCPSWCFGDHDEYIICGKECSELEECEAEIRGSASLPSPNQTAEKAK